MGTDQKKSSVTRDVTKRFETKQWFDRNPVIQTGIFKIDPQGASTVFLEIFWEIVALYDQNLDVISEGHWESVGIVDGSAERAPGRV